MDKQITYTCSTCFIVVICCYLLFSCQKFAYENKRQNMDLLVIVLSLNLWRRQHIRMRLPLAVLLLHHIYTDVSLYPGEEEHGFKNMAHFKQNLKYLTNKTFIFSYIFSFYYLFSN